MKLKTLKNKYVLTYPLLSLGLVLGSCSQEDNGLIPEIGSQNKTITFTVNPVTAETKDISTRVTVESTGRYFDNLKWEDDDQVTFYFLSESFREAIRTFTVSVDGSTTSITGGYPSAVDEYKIRALYPHNASNFSGSATYLTIPAEQTHKDDNSHLSDFIFMYARPEGTVRVDAEGNATGSNIALDFELLTSLLRFDITNESSSEITLQSVSISYPEGSGAVLVHQAVLNEEEGSVSPRSGSSYVHSTQTLKFSDFELQEGDETQGFLSVFPTTSAAALHIDLNILLSDGTPCSILYVINNIQALLAGNRYSIPLTVFDSDLPAISPFPTTFYDGYEYTHLDYFHDFPAVVNINSMSYIPVNNYNAYACPDGFHLFTSSHLPSDLYARSQLIMTLFGETTYYSHGTVNNGNLFILLSATGMFDFWDKTTSSLYNTWAVSHLTGYHIAVRCRRAIN